jgi:glycogen synthase
LLEKIEFFELDERKLIRYPFHPFHKLEEVIKEDIISFLKFSKENGFVFTNINAKNIIQTISRQMKLIDYGKSFEPYTEGKFKNAVKRAYLLYKFPKMENEIFQKLTKKINKGEKPCEIEGWEEFYNQLN